MLEVQCPEAVVFNKITGSVFLSKDNGSTNAQHLERAVWRNAIINENDRCLREGLWVILSYFHEEKCCFFQHKVMRGNITTLQFWLCEENIILHLTNLCTTWFWFSVFEVFNNISAHGPFNRTNGEELDPVLRRP